MNKQRTYLRDILDRIDMIERFTQEGRDVFMQSEEKQEAVMRCYEIIGEIVKRIEPAILATHDEIPWNQITGFRDFLIHNYDKVKQEIVWLAVQDELAPLKTAVEDMLTNTPDE